MRPASPTQYFTIPEGSRGKRLDQVLTGLVREHSRTRLQAWIKSGRVKLGGEVNRKPGWILQDETELELDPEPYTSEAPAAMAPLHAVFEDDAILVIDKPAGLLTHKNARGGEHSVVDLAAQQWGTSPTIHGPDRGGLAHRLDRDTSGLMVLGRTMEALEVLKRAFQERKVEKTYLALVQGAPRFDTDWIETNLGRSPKHRDRISVMAEGTGRVAVTYYEVRERFQGYALLAVFPKTGRMHQVRVHLASIGLPLVGEKLYRPKRGGPWKLPDGAPAMMRHALHASKLAFAHPTSGEKCEFEAPLPKDLAELLAWFRAHPRA